MERVACQGTIGWGMQRQRIYCCNSGGIVIVAPYLSPKRPLNFLRRGFPIALL
jgi:hypothetical protein